MRTPARRQKTYAKRITKLASQDDDTNKLLMDIVAAINETTADNPYMKDKDLKKKIIKQFMKDGHDV
jgi:hypothetical protein